MPTDPTISRIICEAYYKKVLDDIIIIIGLFTNCGNLYNRGYEKA